MAWGQRVMRIAPTYEYSNREGAMTNKPAWATAQAMASDGKFAVGWATVAGATISRSARAPTASRPGTLKS